jgi:methionyl aminopeptidase
MLRLVAISILLLIVASFVLRRIANAGVPASSADNEIAAEARSLAVVLDRIFDRIEVVLKDGLATREIDQLVQREITVAGVGSSFLGYHGYPAYCSTSINEEVVNTIPSDRRLKSGDLLKLQVGISGKHTFAIRGWTYAIGSSSDEDKRLITIGRAALSRAIAAAQLGARTGDIGFAIQSTVEEAGFSVDRSYIGFRIGTAPHADPPIPGHGVRGRGQLLKRNWVLSLFAIVHAGSPDVVIADDRWNTLSKDGRRSVLFSQMVLIREGGAESLTRQRQ